jgi:hypothetical protein
MALYYLDIETYGEEDKINFEKDKIISIRFQEIKKDKINVEGITKLELNPIGKMTILNSWESSEEDILKEFSKSHFFDYEKNSKIHWLFIPIGTNLNFDFRMLFYAFKRHNIDVNWDNIESFISEKPRIDISSILVLINGLSFQGSSLSNLGKKKLDGKAVLDFYRNKEYKKIEDYMRMEDECFFDAFKKIYKNLRSLNGSLKT